MNYEIQLKTDQAQLTMPFRNAEVINYFIEKARSSANSNPYESRAWLLTASSLAPTVFPIQLEAYALEKRLGSVEGSANQFITLFKRFIHCLDQEIAELGNAVREHHMYRGQGKEKEDQLFLLQVFNALPEDIQMEVLMQRSEQTTVINEKCQFMLLLVKLYPDTVDTKGVLAELLYNVLGCESDVNSTFRHLLVNELVPVTLQLSKNLSASTRLVTLLNQCIEYYTLVPDPLLSGRNEDFLEMTANRWEKLFAIVDQIGIILGWKIFPFFSTSSHNSSGSVEFMFQNLKMAVENKSRYLLRELAYASTVLFLRCLITADQLASLVSSNFGGGTAKLTLVEVFYPQNSKNSKSEVSYSINTTVSHHHAVSSVQRSINSYFLTAVQLWKLISTQANERLEMEKEVRGILVSMKSLNLETWPVFQKFLIDYRLYVGEYNVGDILLTEHPLKLASMMCSMKNYRGAAEAVLKVIEALKNKDGSNFDENSDILKKPLSSICDREDLSFFNTEIAWKEKSDFSVSRRLHFISEDRNEIIYYIANILICCFHNTLHSGRDEYCIGHLITLLQLEWPSPAAEIIMDHIMEEIRTRGNFSYYPYFGDFVIEPDFLEMFMYIANHESNPVVLELFTMDTMKSPIGSRRMATRGVDKGAKNDFRLSMKKQMMRNDGSVRTENLIQKFLSVHASDILRCFPK